MRKGKTARTSAPSGGAKLATTAATRLQDLLAITKSAEAERLLNNMLATGSYKFVPLGSRTANAGLVELGTDSCSGLVERITNSIDAVIEMHYRRSGPRDAVSPRAAAEELLHVPRGRVADLVQEDRQQLANAITVTFRDGSRKKRPTILVRDYGIGQGPGDLPTTILSLGESNKIGKHHLCGAYGQGGSSTYSWCPYTVIISRRQQDCLSPRAHDAVGWTIVRYNDSDIRLKTGVYEYLVLSDGSIPTIPNSDFSPGTYIAHIDYEMDRAGGLIGYADGAYQVLNNLLFDPVIPYWIDDERYDYPMRRVMAGNSARLASSDDSVEYHNEYEADLGCDGILRIRYWVLKSKADGGLALDSYLERKNSRNIVAITLNGQRQATLDREFIKDRTRLSFVTRYLLVQVECDRLSVNMKRQLFSSTRERLKTGQQRSERIEAEVAQALQGDPRLLELEHDRRIAGLAAADEAAQERVHRLLDKYLALPQPIRAKKAMPVHPPAPPPVQHHDPPTFLEIGNKKDPIHLPQGTRVAIVVRSDAPDDLLDRVSHPGRLEISLSGIAGVTEAARTHFRDGALRVYLDVESTALVGAAGTVGIELTSDYFTAMADLRAVEVTSAPVSPAPNKTHKQLPQYQVVPVVPGDPNWVERGWDDSWVGDCEKGDEIIFFVSLGHADFIRDKNVRRLSDDTAQRFSTKYQALIAYHLYQLMVPRERQKGLHAGQTEEESQDELRRVAKSVLLSMRPESDLE